MGKQWKQCQTLFFWAPESLQMVTAAMKLKHAYSLEEKLDRLDLIKTKNFCLSMDTTKKVKRQPIGWKQIFANHISDKEFVSRVYKELITQ